MSKTEERMAETQRHFRAIVWPEIEHWFTDGLSDTRLVNTEEGREALSDEFDWHAGVDFWLFGDNWCAQSIASRVQAGYRKDTFTIRYKVPSGGMTEHQKRIKAYRSDHAMLPRWTVQAYIDATLGVLQTAACISTVDLYEYILAEKVPITEEDLIASDSSDTDFFYTVKWASLLGGTDIRIYNWEHTDLNRVDHQRPIAYYGESSP